MAHHDINFFITVIGAILRRNQAIGYHADVIPHHRDIQTKFRGLRPVNIHFPLNTGQGTTILYIAETAQLIKRTANLLRCLFQLF